MRKPQKNPKPATPKAAVAVAPRSRIPAWLSALVLVLVTMALFWPATSCDFVSYDDGQYVLDNPHVTSGLTLANLRWALGSGYAGNWHPVTWVSHMVDCRLFGLKPWGHHLTSVLLHASNTLLVFLLLRGLTGAIWRSLLVAALFGFHPLHVESVAWVAERKDVLSTCFGLLSLIFYARYAQRKTANCQLPTPIFHLPSSIFYLLSLCFFALGLMSKPMLVTWPFVLLLLDYWPLQRFTFGPRLSTLDLRLVWRLLAEKLPFFALAAAASVVTFAVQKHAGAVRTVEHLPPGARVGNALISYCRYLGKTFWPTDLAVFYPHPGYWPQAEVLLAGGLLLGITVFLFVNRGRYPFMLMGWLWYAGTLVPVIGLAQVGDQSMADRYAYIPSLGVSILTIWGARAWFARWRHHRIALSVAGITAIILCLVLTRQQLGYWRDSETLFRHALAVTQDNHIAHKSLGDAFDKKGRTAEAISQYQEAIRLKPEYADAHNNLGAVLGRQGQNDEAISQYQTAIRLRPDYPDARYNLGNALGSKGRIDEAIALLREAIRLKPDYAAARNDLGTALGIQGKTDEAISQFQEVIRLKPDYAEARNNLGTAFFSQGRIDEAIRQYQEALRLKLEYAEARYNLGHALGSQGRIDEAIALLWEAVRLKPDYAVARNDLGTALGIQGKTDEAINQFQEALRLKPDFTAARDNLARAQQMKNAPAAR